MRMDTSIWFKRFLLWLGAYVSEDMRLRSRRTTISRNHRAQLTAEISFNSFLLGEPIATGGMANNSKWNPSIHKSTPESLKIPITSFTIVPNNYIRRSHMAELRKEQNSNPSMANNGKNQDVTRNKENKRYGTE